MRRTLGFALAVALVGGGTVFVSSTPQAAADPADGSLKIRVVRDINGNGSYEAALEVGVKDIVITVTAPDCKTAAGTTAADDTVTVSTTALAGGKYRVDTKIPDSMSYLKPAPAGKGLSMLNSFVAVSAGKAVELTIGVWNPADYCQENPELVTACQLDLTTFKGDPKTSRSLVTFPWTARNKTAATTRAKQADTGTVFGMGCQKDQKRIFSSAYAKRLTDYGTGGRGGIYVTAADGSSTKLFAKVPNAGTTAHKMSTNADGPFYAIPGKESLGDIELSEDGTELYAVNMADRKLYIYDAIGATAGAAKSSVAIPDLGCKAASDWRPTGLGVRDGTLWVGGVCSGQSSKSINDVRAIVLPFKVGAFGTKVIDQKLGFQRGSEEEFEMWGPWDDVFATNERPPSGEPAAYLGKPMPMLSDIGVEANGDLVLAFRDRFGDMGGNETPFPNGQNFLLNSISAGDLNRACLQPDGKFAWEGTGNCPNNLSKDPGKAGGESNKVIEYYPGEYYTDSDAQHRETSLGGLAVVLGEDWMPVKVMDPLALNTNGTGWFDRTNGTIQQSNHANSLELIADNKPNGGFGKAAGLADLEALCDLAPVQIGNRIWFDTDADGVQDGDEPPVPGVKAQLIACAGGAVVATKTTDAKGEYYFGTADGLKAETCYNDLLQREVRLFGRGHEQASRCPSLGDAELDRQGSRYGSLYRLHCGPREVTTGKAGSVDHCVDGGLTVTKQTNKLGDFVWNNKNANGLQDPDEPVVPGVKVTLKDGASTTTGPDGKYLFDNLPDGTYQVCFDVANLPEAVKGYVLTKVDAGDDTKDSDADATGCTKTTTLGPDKREDLTLDAGVVTRP